MARRAGMKRGVRGVGVHGDRGGKRKAYRSYSTSSSRECIKELQRWKKMLYV